MVSFILNNALIKTDKPAGMSLLDFIRYEADLKATKIGCREGDCGACTVLEGSQQASKMSYKTITSCLTPLGNIHGKHIVTTEGINQENLSPVQEALVDNNGTQCGFCTPGFVMSLTGFLINTKQTTLSDAIAAMDGNICRCTGYKSIERAAEKLVQIKSTIGHKEPVTFLIENKILPAYFNEIPSRLRKIKGSENSAESKLLIGGGTDLMVQQADTIFEQELNFINSTQLQKGIQITDNYCTIGAEATATEIMESKELQLVFPNLKTHFKLISSTPIRNMGTVAGNLVNASPIGDLSIFFLALNAEVYLKEFEGKRRKVPLKEFFLEYKTIDKKEDEIIEKIGFQLPDKNDFFNFEKVSKRQFLDIASVNSAICFGLKDKKLENLHLSAGGVAPIPLYLKKTSAYLNGKELSAEILEKATLVLQEEISPISDIRGTEDYKRLLMKQLFYAHFIELLPETVSPESLLKANTI